MSRARRPHSKPIRATRRKGPLASIARWFRPKPTWDLGLDSPNQGAQLTGDTIFSEAVSTILIPKTDATALQNSKANGISQEQLALEQQADQLRAEISDLHATLAELTMQRTAASAQVAQLKNSIEKEIQTIKADIDRHTKVRDHLLKRSQEIEAERQKTITQRKTELAKLQIEINLLEQDIEVNQVLRDELKPMHEKLIQKQEERALIEQSLAQSSATLEGLQATAHETEEMIAKLRKEIAGNLELIDKLNNESGILDHRYQTLEELRSRRTEELTRVQEQLMAVEHELQKTQTSFHNRFNELQTQKSSPVVSNDFLSEIEPGRPHWDIDIPTAPTTSFNIGYEDVHSDAPDTLSARLTLRGPTAPLPQEIAPSKSNKRTLMLLLLLAGILGYWLFNWFSQAPPSWVMPAATPANPSSPTAPSTESIPVFQFSTELSSPAAQNLIEAEAPYSFENSNKEQIDLNR